VGVELVTQSDSGTLGLAEVFEVAAGVLFAVVLNLNMPTT
jgi:hypothetical protein